MHLHLSRVLTPFLTINCSLVAEKRVEEKIPLILLKTVYNIHNS